MTRVRDVMTRDPLTCVSSASATDAARLMRDQNIGDILIEGADSQLRGIVTDRDIVVRCVADERNPADVTLAELCTKELVTVSPDADVHEAAKLMRDNAIRRLPVTDDGRPVGIVSLGDLAIEEDPSSALARISAARPSC